MSEYRVSIAGGGRARSASYNQKHSSHPCSEPALGAGWGLQPCRWQSLGDLSWAQPGTSGQWVLTPDWPTIASHLLTPFSFVTLGSSESVSSPNLFPLVSCENSLSDDSHVTVGCLAKDFLPSSVTFSWSYKNNSDISSQAIQNFPSVLREGKYAASSKVVLPSININQGTDEFLLCNVKHSNGDKNVHVPIAGETGPLLSWAGELGPGQSRLTVSPHHRCRPTVPQCERLHPTP